MTIVTRKDRAGASRAKLALVGVLSLVLVAVIVAQLPGSSEDDNVATASVTEMPGWEGEQQQPAANPVANSGPAPPVADKPAREWPELAVTEVVANDPLAAPAWYLAATGPEETADAKASNTKPTEKAPDPLVLAQLQQTGATIVLIANGQRIATIGERQIHIGDTIEGYQVSDITDEGVILTRSRTR